MSTKYLERNGCEARWVTGVTLISLKPNQLLAETVFKVPAYWSKFFNSKSGF